MRKFNNVHRFLEGGAKRDVIESQLSNQQKWEIRLIDEFLQHFDGQSGREWRNRIASGDFYQVLGEISLFHHFTESSQIDRLELNVPITDDPNGSDFDFRLTIGDRRVWIEVAKPDIVEEMDRIFEARRNPEMEVEWTNGWGASLPSWNAITRKLNGSEDEEGEFEVARRDVRSDDLLVLAVHLNVVPLQQILIRENIEEGYFDIGDRADGWILFKPTGRGTRATYEYHNEAGKWFSQLFEEMQNSGDFQLDD